MTTTTRSEDVPLRTGFDHALDPDLLHRHYDEWNRLREDARAFRSDFGGPYNLWYLLRYDDVSDALHEYETFSSRTVQYVGETTHRMIPEELDPPEHTKYRQLLSAYLSPGRVLAMEGDIRAECIALVETIALGDGCDFLRDFSRRFPTRIFLKIMGLPLEQTDVFVARAHTVLGTRNEDDPDFSRRGSAALEIIADLATAIEDHRSVPRNNLLGTLLTATVDERPLTDDELYQMGFLLYLAGLDTVANVLAYTFWELATYPSLRARIAAEPNLAVPAVEEFLRKFSVATTVREVTHDVEFAGCPMKAGDRVVLPTAAASRDPRRFDDPDGIEIGRSANRHLAFGAGPHRCVGAHLARLEMRIALEEWHRRIPEYRVAEGIALTEHVGPVAGLDALPLRWP